MSGRLGRSSSVAGALPDTLQPYNQFPHGTVTRVGMRVLYCVGTGISGGGTVTIAHGMNRLPNWVSVKDNPGAYKGDCFFVSKTATSCVVQVELAQNVGAVIEIA